MTGPLHTRRLLFVTGLAGAGKSTVLNALEDLGWETIDNFPVRLTERLIKTRPPTGTEEDMQLALGFDSRTRGFHPEKLIERVNDIGKLRDLEVSTLFLDCSGVELQRRYAETRRRHPMAPDRPLDDGIAMERSLLDPLRRWADEVIDTTRLSASDLKDLIRRRFGNDSKGRTVLQVTSFGYARGIPVNADLVFDMRFLRNPHWVPKLRPMTGLDAPIADYVSEDPALEEALQRIKDLLIFLIPKYEAQGKAYVNIAFGCTGGRHRSVFVAETMGKWLKDQGFSPAISHRNLASRPIEALEGAPAGGK